MNERKIGKKARILLVDDHDIVRFGMSQVINKQADLEVCAEAATVKEAINNVRKNQPDLVIADITLKSSNGIELVKTLHSEFPELPILVMSMHDENIWAEVALNAGAMGYLMKEDSINQLLPAIRKVLSGKIYLSSEISERFLETQFRGRQTSAGSPFDRLSERERQVFQMIGQWKTTRQIADELSLSVKTVEYYRDNLKTKLGLRSGTELVQAAVDATRGAANPA
jgi:DNA-binding NarL/FixJ family response regulator